MKPSGIDHVVIVTPSLEDSRREFESLGFTVAPRARHPDFGTANHLCVLRDAYIELLGRDPDAAPGAVPAEAVERSLRAGGGLAMIALASDDAVSFAGALRAAGLRTDAPRTWTRPADTPSGPTTATFTTFFVEDDPFPCFTLFCCQQHTRGAIWCDAWIAHANGARRLLGLHRTTSADVPGLAQAYARVAGPPCVGTSGTQVRVSLGAHRLDFAAGATAERTVIRLAAAGEGRAPVALSTVPAVAIEFVADPV